jgi:hypothetical protein
MAAKHTTMRGEPIDMGALIARNESKIALGNANMNARGDIVGPGGIVLRTQEQIDEEWRKARESQQQSESISNDIKAPLPPDIQGKDPAMMQDRDFDPNAVQFDLSNGQQSQQRRRKIVESD